MSERTRTSTRKSQRVATSGKDVRLAVMNGISAKRTEGERRGVHAWLPYYAGYSEAFVASALRELGLRDGALVLDPMNGSGTTTLVAQQHGFDAIGLDLNPAPVVIARAKDAVLARCDLIGEVSGVLVAARSTHEPRTPSEDVRRWMHPSALIELWRIERAIAAQNWSPHAVLAKQLTAAFRGGAASVPAHSTTGEFLKAVLLVTARQLSRAEVSKNPTWLKASASSSLPTGDVFEAFTANAERMAHELQEAFPSPARDRSHLAVATANAADQPIKSRAIDAIITSPPYLTRIDYAVGTSAELVALGLDSDESRDGLRRKIMGSTCITEGPWEVKPIWGKICGDLLVAVQRHPSKASAGYYFRNHVQYFRDAESILRECLRVLKPLAPALFVVQDSWYKDVHVPLAEIYVEMAKNLGAASAVISNREQVKSHLGLVNRGARKYQKGKLHESVVLIRGSRNG